MTELRARHGDAPRWVLVPVLLTWLGVPVGVVVYLALGAALRWDDTPYPGPAISVWVVLVLLGLLRGAASRRPMIAVDRTYFRLALVVIGVMGLGGTWRVGAVVAVLGLVHSLYADRVVKPSPGRHPVVKGG